MIANLCTSIECLYQNLSKASHIKQEKKLNLCMKKKNFNLCCFLMELFFFSHYNGYFETNKISIRSKCIFYCS